MKKIVCIGQSCKDTFFPTVEGKIIDTPKDLMAQKKIEFELGAKYKVEERFEALGGCAANVAVGLAKLGIEPVCYSHIGDDYISSWILEQLKKNKVDTSYITKEPNCPSDLSAIIVDKDSGERIIFSNQVANAKLKIEPEKIEKTEWFFIGDLHGDWKKHLNIILETARKNNIRVAYNPRQANIHDDVETVVEIISGCNILFLNKDESIEVLSGTGNKYPEKELNDESFLLKELNKLGSGVVAITDGVRGAWATNGKDVVHIPGIKVEAKDSTGAGDAFTSAFLAAHIKGKSLAECVWWGIANSSSEVQFYGSIEGLLDEENIKKIISI